MDACGVRPAREARVSGGRVETGQTADVGGGRGVQQLLGPRQGLEQLHREAHQRGVGGDVGRHLEVTSARAPTKAGTKVADLELHPVDGVAPPWPVPTLPSGGRFPREARRVPVARPLERARLREAVLGELPDGLEQAVPRV